MTLLAFNAMTPTERLAALSTCCGSTRWAEALNVRFPFTSSDDLYRAVDDVFSHLEESDWLEAFSHHPRIGDLATLKQKFASTAQLAGAEQGAVAHAEESVLKQLAESNDRYFNKFGFIFIVCATGKSAPEMLDLLLQRIDNSRAEEIKNAAREQQKITRLRLEKGLQI